MASKILSCLPLTLQSTLALVLLIIIKSTLCYEPLPDGYQSLSAKDKLNVLWGRISDEPYDIQNLPTAPPSAANMTELTSVDFMSQTFLHTGDDMPPGRPKIPHAHGVACKVQLSIYPNNTAQKVGSERCD